MGLKQDIWLIKEGLIIGFIIGWFLAMPILNYFGSGSQASVANLKESVMQTQGIVDGIMRGETLQKVSETKAKLLLATIGMFIGGATDYYFTKRKK